jgi:hypothetical protein
MPMTVQSPRSPFDYPLVNSPDLGDLPEDELLDLCKSILKTELRNIPRSLETMILFVEYAALHSHSCCNVDKIKQIAKKLLNPAGYDHCSEQQRRLRG